MASFQVIQQPHSQTSFNLQ